MMKRPKVQTTAADDNAGIQYAGVEGASKECQDAVVRLLQYGDRIVSARILTCGQSHSLLLTVGVGDFVAIKSGFASGYAGGGPTRFSYTLQFLDSFGVEIEEYEVTEDVIGRLDSSSLSHSDLNMIRAARPVRPTRWHDYVQEQHRERAQNGTLWDEFPLVVPFSIVDPRLIDLAISFWEEPDGRLLDAYRRLEDIVRERTGIDEHGVKLFAQAFAGRMSKLHWRDVDTGEQDGRAQLFASTFRAFRNRRAHSELNQNGEDQLAEFLLLNQLFRLEREATEKPADKDL